MGSGERDRKICWKRKPRRIATLNTVGECCAERRTHARTERRLRESRTGWIRTGWNQIHPVPWCKSICSKDSTKGLGGIHSVHDSLKRLSVRARSV